MLWERSGTALRCLGAALCPKALLLTLSALFVPFFLIAFTPAAFAEQDGTGSEIIPVGVVAGNKLDVGIGKFVMDGVTGNVGIGSSVPQLKLDVEGSVYVGNGNIGVGSSAPAQKVDVVGTVRATAFIGDGAGLTGLPGGWTRTGTNVYVTTSSDNVGIGTSVPLSKLDLVGSGTTSATRSLVIRDSTRTATVTVLDNGYVGIGTNAPGAALDVVGDIRTTGWGLKVFDSTGVFRAGLSDISGNYTGIWGDGNGAAVNPAIAIKADNTGLGTTVPRAKLDVEGSVYFGNGNVGIGSSAPQSMLDVAGTVNSTWFISPMHSAGSYAYSNAGYYYNNISRDAIVVGTQTALGAYPWRIQSGNAATYTDGYITLETAGLERVRVNGPGNVGIGSSVPQAKLDIEGSVYVGNGNIGIGTATTVSKLDIIAANSHIHIGTGGDNGGYFTSITPSNFAVSGGTNYNGNWVAKDTVAEIIAGANGGWEFYTNSGLTVGNTFSPTLRMLITSSGNVGIGSSVPQAKLDVEGGVYVGNGNVGIGTSAPNLQLQVYSSTTTATGGLQSVNNGALFELNRWTTGAGSAAVLFKTAGTERFAVGLDNDSTDSFYIGDSNSFTNKWLAINTAGNVGINSSVPRAKLDVEGSVYFGNGNIGVASTAPGQKIDVTGTVRATAFLGDGSGLSGLGATAWSTSGSNVYVTNSSYTVGIGSSVPQAKLDVEGSVYVGNGNVGLGTSVPTSTLQVVSTGTLQIPYGTAPSVSLAGHVALDTTADQVVYYGGAERILSYDMTRCGYFTDIQSSDDQIALGAWSVPVTITGIGCTYNGTGTTKATLTLEDGGGSAMTITGTNPTCTANGSDFTFAAVTAGNTLNAGEIVRFNVTNIPSPTTDDYTICVKYVYTRQ
jgi:hypothetical protein